jgi:D-alanine-D-alanine ligase-like ATP-grasp enzyme
MALPSISSSSLYPVSAAASSVAASQQLSDDSFHPIGESSRAFVKIIKEFATEYNVHVEAASHNWLMRLTKGDTVCRVIGYELGLNNSDAKRICDDKAATSTFLGDIPHIPHILMLNRELSESPKIEAFGKKHNWNIVTKPLDGCGGLDVNHTKTREEFQLMTRNLLAKYQKICLSPFHDIQHEFRLIMLNNKPLLVFKKIRPHIIGDGKSTILQLFTNFNEKMNGPKDFKSLSELAVTNYTAIPKTGEIIYLNWKHNLSQGATCEILDHTAALQKQSPETPSSGEKRKSGNASPEHSVKRNRSSESDCKLVEAIPKEAESDLLKNLIGLAEKATKAVGVVFVSADIAQMKDGSIKVMEINNTVGMENLAAQNGATGMRKAKEVYTRALCFRMNIKYESSPELSLKTRAPIHHSLAAIPQQLPFNGLSLDGTPMSSSASPTQSNTPSQPIASSFSSRDQNQTQGTKLSQGN